MRFLIVNGYNNDKAGNLKFQAFKNAIEQFISNQKELMDTENEYYVRDLENIEDFLYEQENCFIRPEYGKQFDSVDIVFVTGNANFRPWSIGMRKILTLFKMCLKTQKIVFATCFGAQVLAYLCASNLTVNITISNNNGEGCKLSDFQRYLKRASQNKQNEYFLDSTTGDLYAYSYDNDEWIPKVNVGVHNRRDAMEYQSIGKYIIKSPTYRPKENNNMFMNNVNFLDPNETICRIKKNYFHHWAFTGIDGQFLLKLNNQWDIHTFAFINPERKFNVLAECNKRGAMILECKNIFACMFEINKKYNETLMILDNFIRNAVRIVKLQNDYVILTLIYTTQNKISIVNDRYFQKQNGLLQNINIEHESNQKHIQYGNPEQILKNQQRAFQLESRQLSGLRTFTTQQPEEEQFFHVGYSVKKSRLPDFVLSNLMSNKKLKIQQNSLQRTKSDQFIPHIDITETNTKWMHNKMNSLASQQVFLKNPSPLTDKHLGQTSKHLGQISKLKSNLQIKIQDFNDKPLSQSIVRQILHPDIDRAYCGNTQFWIPGSYNSRSKPKENVKKFILNKQRINTEKDSIYRIIEEKNNLSHCHQTSQNHKFRQITRNKWITNQDFLV